MALKQCARLLEDPHDDESDTTSQTDLVLYGSQMKDMLNAIWDDQNVDVFDSGYAYILKVYH